MSKWWEKKDPANYSEWQTLQTPEGLDYYYNTVTNVTTWDKPDALKSADELSNQGDWVWMPDDRDCFIPATVQSQDGNQVSLRDQSGGFHTISAKIKLQPLKPASLQRVVSDLVLLDNMSVPLILHNLRERFKKKQIYTNVGTIIISINPYCNLGLYTPEVIHDYQYRGVKEMPPHVFNTAHDSYKGITDFGTPQSIIISGESGAGKTEATKQCLTYLAAIAGSVDNVETKILQANPILEAFGNAKTVRNDNSSRFGKYMEVYFDSNQKICGATTTNYLLEKIRVVATNQGERNFHVFYQMVKAADQATRTRTQLCNSCSDYTYLAGSGCIDVPTLDDNYDWTALNDGMRILNFKSSDQEAVFDTVAAILNLGNVTFRGHNAQVAEQGWVDCAARLLKVEPSKLATALTIRELRIRGQQATKVPLKEKEASDTRHALAKFIYGNMFDWIVQQVNKAMVKPSGKAVSIGILDIFGFEIFQHNSFEQLCINFTNEMLQQHFNNNTFKLEEKLYAAENIHFKHVDFIDNQPVLDLIQQRPNGILPTLDEELVMPKGSDQTFLDKMHNKQGRSKLYKKVMKNPDHFIVHHYAGQVEYDALGFLEKNRDTLTDDLLEMLATSKSPFLNQLFPKTISTKDRKSSLSKQFQGQLKALMQTLYKTEPHYIRCVKPNDEKSASTFTPRNCLEQLTYSGVFEAVAIRKQGFPFRLKHDKFVEHYKCVMPDPKARYGSATQGCNAIIKHMNLNTQNVAMGSTMVFYRSDEHKALDLQRSIKVVRIRMEENLDRLIKVSISGYSEKQKEKYFEELSRAVEQADEFRLTTTAANKARKLLDDYIESRIDEATKRRLKEAYDAVNRQLLEDVIAHCDRERFKTKQVKECKKLLNRIKRIDEEVEVVGRTLDEQHVRVVVYAADEIGYYSDWLQYFRDLVNGPYMTFLTAQYDMAVQNGNHDRAIRVDIKRKDEMYKAEANNWVISRYPKLKSPLDWAKEKFLGNKAELAAGMLVWAKDKIHSCLCKYDHITDKQRLKEVKLTAKHTETYILKLIGQRASKTKTATARGAEMVELGIKFPEIRDEIFIQIVKCATNNPDPQASKLCWDVMGMCLMTFPPSTDFENYMEVYLRNHAPKGGTFNQHVGWLRQRVYHGALQTAPTEQDMMGMEGVMQSRSRGFSEHLPPGQPSFHDLTEPYAATQVKQTFQRDAPIAAGAGGHQRAPSMQAATPAAAAAPTHAWIECVDEGSGDVYYYNQETGESAWDKPAEMVSFVAPKGRGW